MRASEFIIEAPDFGYSQYNDREYFFKNVSFDTKKLGDHYVTITAIFHDTKIGNIDLYVTSKVKKIIQVRESLINPHWKGSGLGQILYDKAIDFSKKNKLKYFQSDVRRSGDAESAWKKLSKRYPVTNVQGTMFDKGDRYQIDLDKIPAKISEGGGYIPQTEEEAHDPRFEMALTCDIHPGEDIKQAAKFNFKLGKGGRPPFLRSNGKLTESTTKLSNLYSPDELEDESEMLYNFVSPDDYENNYQVKTMFPSELKKLETGHSFDTVLQTFNDYATVDQKKIVRNKMKNFDPNRIVVVAGKTLLDGNHHVIAAIKLNKPSKYIDINSEPENSVHESKDQFTKKTDFRFNKGALLMQRIGPINAQKQIHIIKKPPVNRGMWAFPYPAFDMFFAHHKIEPLLPADLRSDAIHATYDKAKEEGRDGDEDFQEAYQHLWDLREKASEKLKDKMRPRTFWWDGPIYSHISPHGGGCSDVGQDWYLWTDLKAWAKAANKSMIALDSFKGWGEIKINPTERGFPTYSVDHLELFLPEKAEITKQKKGR